MSQGAKQSCIHIRKAFESQLSDWLPSLAAYGLLVLSCRIGVVESQEPDRATDSPTAKVQVLIKQLRSNNTSLHPEAILELGRLEKDAAPAIPDLTWALLSGQYEVWTNARISLVMLGSTVVAESDRLNRTPARTKSLRLLIAGDERHKIREQEKLQEVFLAALNEEERLTYAHFLEKVRKSPAAKLPVLIEVLEAEKENTIAFDFALRHLTQLELDGRAAIPLLKKLLAGLDRKCPNANLIAALAAIGHDNPEVVTIFSDALTVQRGFR